MVPTCSPLVLATLLALVGACLSQPTLNGDGRPVVDVSQGRILGVQETQNNFPVLIYRAIPFAKPPVDELRFMPPLPAEPWVGDLDASSKPHSCVQLGAIGKEDCLYLNVYTPYDAVYTNSSLESLPVLVFIHGGGYVTGSAEPFDSCYPLIEQGVIVVAIQYRLGILGFLSTDDDVAPGNQGLKDQTLAIKWVHDNIAAFGGDPEKITIAGQSAGGASTHFQLLTPYAHGLFQSAILMSGSAFHPWSVGRDFYNTSRAIGRRFDCPLDNSTELIACLQSTNYLLISDLIVAFFDWNFQPFSFAPRVDGDYLPDQPASLVKEGRYNKVPCIMGTVRNEGAIESGEMYAKPFLIHSLTENFTTNGPVVLELFEDEDPINTSYEAFDYYLGGLYITDENADNFTKLLTDRLFHVSLDWLVQQQADQSEVFMYQFNYRGQFGYMDQYIKFGLNLTAAEDWISHSDDLQYLFQFPDAPGPEENINDMTVRTIYTKLFSNFIKFGNPTPDETFLGFLWTAASAADLKHLSIALPSAMQDDTRQDVRSFWEGLPLRINSILLA